MPWSAYPLPSALQRSPLTFWSVNIVFYAVRQAGSPCMPSRKATMQTSQACCEILRTFPGILRAHYKLTMRSKSEATTGSTDKALPKACLHAFIVKAPMPVKHTASICAASPALWAPRESPAPIQLPTRMALDWLIAKGNCQHKEPIFEAIEWTACGTSPR